MGVWRALLAAKCESGQRSWLIPLSSGCAFSYRVHGETSQRFQQFYQALTFLGQSKILAITQGIKIHHCQWCIIFLHSSYSSCFLGNAGSLVTGLLSSHWGLWFPLLWFLFPLPPVRAAWAGLGTLFLWVVSHCQHCSLQWCSPGILACQGLGCYRTVRTLKALLHLRAWGWAVSWLDSELETKQLKRLGSVSVMINWNFPVNTNQGFNWIQVTTTFLSLGRDVLQQTLPWVHWPAGACQLTGQPRH